MSTPETRRQLLAAVAACEDKKGEDTRILELDASDSGLADFFLITSASNDRQVVAIADEIEFRLKKEFGLYATSVEGRRQAEWILLDYVDIVIHVFLAEKRAFYDIERLRKSARNLTGAEVEDELKSALAQKTRAVRSHSAPAPAGTAKRTPSRPTKSSKGVSTVSAKPTKKAAKKAAKKAPAKPAAKKAVKPAAKKATKAVAPKAPAKKSSLKPGKQTAAKAATPAKKQAAKAAPKKAAKKSSSDTVVNKLRATPGKLPGKTKPPTAAKKSAKKSLPAVAASAEAPVGAVSAEAPASVEAPGPIVLPTPPPSSEFAQPIRGAKPPVIK